jgi:hypothetical protein
LRDSPGAPQSHSPLFPHPNDAHNLRAKRVHGSGVLRVSAAAISIRQNLSRFPAPSVFRVLQAVASIQYAKREAMSTVLMR